MTKTRIGILGCASIAVRSVIPAIKELVNEFEVVAVASRDIHKAQRVAKQFGCQAIEGYQQMIERNDIDAIYMPLPTGLHFDWIKRSINSGKHVYVEKSFALSCRDTEELLMLAKDRKIALMEGYMFQYHPQHKFVKELINNDEIGEIRSFSASFCFPPLDKGNFRYDPKIGGGTILDAAGYTVRATCIILGNALELEAATVKYQNGCSIYGSAFMRGTNGLGIYLVFGFDNFYQCEYSILGSKGKITLLKAFTPLKNEKPVCVLDKQNIKMTYSLPSCDHFIEAFKEFHNIINKSECRNRHYEDIMVQSRILTDIFKISSGPINE